MLSGLISPKFFKHIHHLTAGLGLVILTAILFTPYIPYSVSLQKGDIAPQTITSPQTMSYESRSDKAKTKELQSQRAQLVENQYSINDESRKLVIASMVNFFTKLNQSSTQNNWTENEEKLVNAYQKYPTLTLKKREKIEEVTLAITTTLLTNGLMETDMQTLPEQLTTQLAPIRLPRIHKTLIANTILTYIKPNKQIDKAKTQDAINEAIAIITPFKTTYKKGMPIIYEGEPVTSAHIDAFKALNIYGVKPNIIKFVGILLANILLFLIFERFIHRFAPKLYTQTKYFYLIYIIVLTVVLLTHFLQTISQVPAMFLIPIPLVALITSTLISPNIALLTGALVAMMIAMMSHSDFGLFSYLFLSNCGATFVITQSTNRTQLIKNGYIVGLINIILVITIGLLTEQSSLTWFGISSSLAFANGILSFILGLGLLPYCESLFKITTSQTLLELANLDHPLLKRLMLTAPGTYQHSIMVANLAEAAAQAINADPILARVGAYYHDIGKMKRPHFYSENQTGENPHESITPHMSKMIIASHPKDGVELAKKYKLPAILLDFMMQHHGTCLVGFFYEQAIQSDDDTTQDDFRYPGPKPQFKESGIVMLADTIEATIRSQKNPNPAKIESLVTKLIKDKIDDHQLDECPLSLKEINTIKTTFLSILNSMYHHRIDYTEEIQSFQK